MSAELETWGTLLSARFQRALASDLRAMTAAVDPQDVVGIGAFADADATNIVAAVHTRSHYAAALERRPRYANFFLWSIGEWDLLSGEQLKVDALQPINDELLATSRHYPEGPPLDAFRATVWNAVVDALAALAREGSFKAFPVAVRVFEPIDGDCSEDDIRSWTARINESERLAEYDAWAANPSS